MRIKVTLAATAVAVLCQCSYVPTLPGLTGARGTDFGGAAPNLVPLSQLLAGLDGETPEISAAGLKARVAALKLRARALRGDVLDARERRLLRRAIANRPQ